MVIFRKQVPIDSSQLLLENIYLLFKEYFNYPPTSFLIEGDMDFLNIFVGNFSDSPFDLFRQNLFEKFAQEKHFRTLKKTGIEYNLNTLETNQGTFHMIMPQGENLGMKSLWIKIPKKLLL